MEEVYICFACCVIFLGYPENVYLELYLYECMGVFIYALLVVLALSIKSLYWIIPIHGHCSVSTRASVYLWCYNTGTLLVIRISDVPFDFTCFFMIEGTIQTKYTEASKAGVGERSAVRKEAPQV